MRVLLARFGSSEHDATNLEHAFDRMQPPVRYVYQLVREFTGPLGDIDIIAFLGLSPNNVEEGFTRLRKMRAAYPEAVPIVVATHHKGQEVIERIKALPNAHYFYRAVDNGIPLVRFMREVIEQRTPAPSAA